jgi:PAS domain S-box-containing protein
MSQVVPIDSPGQDWPAASVLFHGEHHFRRLLETLPTGAYTCDSTGLITYFNQHAVHLWGRAPKLDDPVDRFCGSFKLFAVDGTPIDHAQCWMALALRDNREYNGHEIIIERPDGRRVTALAHANPVHDESGRLIGAVNILVDITDRNRAQEERAARLADLTRLHEMSGRVAADLELQPILDGILQTAAALEETELGLLTLCEPDFTHPRIGASLGFETELLEEIGHTLPSGGAIRDGQRVIIEDIESDLAYAPFREVARRAGFRAAHSTPLITRAGRILGVLSTFSRWPRRPSERDTYLLDLCARQAVDSIENARLIAQVREADRRKDEFLATLAHELRNPLAPIQNAVHILRHHGPSDPALQWSRDVIDRQVRQMSRLVDDLLDLSRITTGKLDLRTARITMAEVLHAAVETSRPLIEASGHELITNAPTEPMELDGDLTRLAQVVANLLNNAAKYTEHGGRIWLSAERQGSDAVISVRDSGIGIPVDMLPHIFDMFAQGAHAFNRCQGGLGIGLTLVKRLVEMHGGSITARSDGPGTGSEFIVRLPALIGRPQSERTLDDNGEVIDRAMGLRILVVDDNCDAAASLGMLLRIMGNDVRTAYDGDAAFALAETFRPHVAVLDIGLPKSNGYEVARHIREQRWGRSMVLIAATGWGQAADRERSRTAGFDHHLVKPVDPAALLRLLAELSRTAAL